MNTLFFLLAAVGASQENWNVNPTYCTFANNIGGGIYRPFLSLHLYDLGAMFGAKAKLTTSYTMQQK